MIFYLRATIKTYPALSLWENPPGPVTLLKDRTIHPAMVLPVVMLLLLPFFASTAEGNSPIDLPEQGKKNLSLTSIRDDNTPTLRLIYGINIGGYLASASTANYYNGSGEHNVEEALNRTHNRDRLINNVDEIISSFEVGDLPQNMRYDPGLLIGFFGGFRFGKSFAVIGEFNYSRLTAADKFTLITDKFTSTSEPYRLLSDIYGVEERNELRLGFQYTLFTPSYIHPYIESGLNLTNTKVVENRVTISGMEFNIREIRSDYYQVRDYGIGFGVYTGLGMHMEVSDNFSFRLGGSVSLSQINLGDNNEIAPLYTAFLRLSLDEVFASSRP